MKTHARCAVCSHAACTHQSHRDLCGCCRVFGLAYRHRFTQEPALLEITPSCKVCPRKLVLIAKRPPQPPATPPKPQPPISPPQLPIPLPVHVGYSYLDRYHALKLLRFDSYQDYLNSPLWTAIRDRAFAIKGNTCSICTGPAHTIHHNRYAFDDLAGVSMDFLVPICRVCHKLIEFDEKGTKRSPKDAFKQYQRLRQLAGRG